MTQSSGKEVSKQLDYVKQQQQLRALENKCTSSKALSAQSMIEDLLSKKDTFQKHKPEKQQKMEMPVWLVQCIPPLYERVWAGVQSGGGLTDTPLLSSLLMSSGLSTDTLGYIWSLANHTVPGALTQPELYLVLALVGLAQTGYVVNNLAALCHLPQAPVPTLDLKLLPTRVTGPQVYPNPLSVTSLPDPLTFNWTSSDTFHPSSAEKIGISYVSSGPMVSPKLVSDQVTRTSNLNSTSFNTKSNITGQSNAISGNSHPNVSIDSKVNPQVKHSSNTCSFSFPSLNDSPSHVVATKAEYVDTFDDEFTDFQSAYFSTTVSVEDEKQTKASIDDEEFMNFQKASPEYKNDDLSVVVIDGKNLPSAQQLWVTDSHSSCAETKNIENETNALTINVPDTIVKDAQIKLGISFGNDSNENKYDAFQEIDDDKYSVFHNPLPDEEDKQSVARNIAVENVFVESKSTFNHCLCKDTESSLDLFKADQAPSLELPKFDSDIHNLEPDENDDDEFSNFQTFAGYDNTQKESQIESFDKYNIFRTIDFQDTSFALDQTETAIVGNSVKRNIEPLEECDVITSAEYDRNISGYNLNSAVDGNESINDIKFSDIEESTTDSSKIDNLFSSLTISTTNNENSIKDNGFLVLDPAEDKYKALRLLETEVLETDDFGEFFGAELPNSTNEQHKQLEHASIQIRCLEACLNLLETGFNMLSKASSPEVITEVLSDFRANTYLDCLLEAHRVSERIICHIEDASCAHIAAELSQVWQSLAPFFAHTEHNHLSETVGAVCSVCKSNTGPSQVTFGPLSLHAPCANLYLHCVEPVLSNIPVAAVQS